MKSENVIIETQQITMTPTEYYELLDKLEWIVEFVKTKEGPIDLEEYFTQLRSEIA